MSPDKSRSGDKSPDVLLFLKSYYRQQEALKNK